MLLLLVGVGSLVCDWTPDASVADVGQMLIDGQVWRLTQSGFTLMREEVNLSHQQSLIVIFGDFW